MIYYSKEPIKIWQPNMLMLDLKTEGYIYVSLNTYNQAIILADKFNYEPSILFDRLKFNKSQIDLYEYMSDLLPTPINMLAPYYNLIGNDVMFNFDDIKELVGVLSYLSMQIDFNAMSLVQPEIRATICYTKRVLKEYQSHYEDFLFLMNLNNSNNKEKEYTPSDSISDCPIDTSVDNISNNSNKEHKYTLSEDGDTIIEEDDFDLEAFLNDVGLDSLSHKDNKEYIKKSEPSKELVKEIEETTEVEEVEEVNNINSNIDNLSELKEKGYSDVYADLCSKYI